MKPVHFKTFSSFERMVFLTKKFHETTFNKNDYFQVYGHNYTEKDLLAVDQFLYFMISREEKISYDLSGLPYEVREVLWLCLGKDLGFLVPSILSNEEIQFLIDTFNLKSFPKRDL